MVLFGSELATTVVALRICNSRRTGDNVQADYYLATLISALSDLQAFTQRSSPDIKLLEAPTGRFSEDQ